MRLRLSARADDDLTSLYEWGLQIFGEAQADRYFDGLLAKFDSILAHPSAGPRRVVEGSEFRIAIHQSHVIVYHVIDADTVLIVRVLHGSQEVGRHVREV